MMPEKFQTVDIWTTPLFMFLIIGSKSTELGSTRAMDPGENNHIDASQTHRWKGYTGLRKKVRVT